MRSWRNHIHDFKVKHETCTFYNGKLHIAEEYRKKSSQPKSIERNHLEVTTSRDIFAYIVNCDLTMISQF